MDGGSTPTDHPTQRCTSRKLDSCVRIPLVHIRGTCSHSIWCIFAMCYQCVVVGIPSRDFLPRNQTWFHDNRGIDPLSLGSCCWSTYRSSREQLVCTLPVTPRIGDSTSPGPRDDAGGCCLHSEALQACCLYRCPRRDIPFRYDALVLRGYLRQACRHGILMDCHRIPGYGVQHSRLTFLSK